MPTAFCFRSGNKFNENINFSGIIQMNTNWTPFNPGGGGIAHISIFGI